MDDFLAGMAEASRRRCAEGRRRRSAESLRGACAGAPPVRPLVLDRFDLIAEIKRVSPAEGRLSAAEDDASRALTQIAARAGVYAAGGAAMISVLTEPTRFSGELAHLAAAARAVEVPVMRKDFLVDPYQVIEARAAGASAVLLIVRMLDDAALAEMLACAAEVGMHALVEAFDAEELGRAGRVLERVLGVGGGPRVLLGLNCRDLTTLRIEPARFAALADAFPAGWPRVAESGIHSADDAAGVAALGYGLALVGTSLMRASDPGALIRGMLRSGRSVAVDGGRS